MSHFRDYITFGQDGAVEAPEIDDELIEEELPKVVYRAKSIASRIAAAKDERAIGAVVASHFANNAIEVGGLSEYTDQTAASLPYPDEAEKQDETRALVVVRGKNARTVLESVSSAGMKTYVPYTNDHPTMSYLRFADGRVCIGDKYQDGLFDNAFAVLKAAVECSASVIFLVDHAAALGDVDIFVAHAEARGIPVFRLADNEAPSMGWVQCLTSSGAPLRDEWVKCSHCGLTFSEAALAKNYYICPTCGSYLRMTSSQRISNLLDSKSFVEWDADIEEVNPLDFQGYESKIAMHREKSGLDEAVRTGVGRIAGIRVAVGVMDSTFMMGSMGYVVGEKLSRMIDRATEMKLPVVIFTASGGARMQEGLVSLMQMAKISCAVERHDAAGLLYISVLCDPTTGGVTASFAMQGDIILAEPRALIGFAGKRVIQDTIRQELPEGFQTAEFALEHGLIDAIVPRSELRSTIAHLLAMHQSSFSVKAGEAVDSGASQNLGENESVFESVSLKLCTDEQKDACAGDETTGARSAEVGEGLGERLQEAWNSVQIARNTRRPTATYYIDHVFDGFIELHGDRAFGDDGAIKAGIAWLDGRVVSVIAEEKGTDLKDRVKRNFGCPQPEGYRKSLRLMRQAEKFNRPIVCFVDTQGAFCGADAEQRGQGNAIADNLFAMASLTVPVVSVLLGEGGSGGALALAVANSIAMQEHAVYSVLSPEGFASILWKDRSRAAEAASVMKMDAKRVCEMGIVDEVLSEGDSSADNNPEQAAENVRAFVSSQLDLLAGLSAEEVVAQRQERFARF